jgi:hypothetical protein
VIRDRLFRAILESLGEDLDDKVFELFAVDVVRQEFPSAVPVLGGSDAGLDGAVGSIEGPRLPIIATTSDRVRDNVRRNLLRHQSEWKALGGRVVVATSSALTPQRQKNVADLVVELGFHLVQLYERQAIAERLYHAPRWRLELLGLPGDPPALTQLPPRVVAPPSIPLVGRDDDLAWLRKTSGDRLLLGPPAIGKTALLEQFARDNGAFFVTTGDAGQIADGARELQPQALIVDDAHARLDVLDEVIRVRSSTGARFDIVATSWTDFHEDARGRLGLSDSQLRELRLLQRSEIAEVIKALGIAGPTWLIKSMLDQADGRVGLAVSLARLSLLGGVKEVVFGEALLRFVQSIEAQVRVGLTSLLAPFAVGGREGLGLEEVAQALRHSTLDLHSVLARIGASGLIRARSSSTLDRAIVVEPEALRAALVRTVFFDSAAPLDIRPFLSLATRPCEVANTLIGARHQGGPVPPALIREWLERCDDRQPWAGYAWLGASEAAWVLEQRPYYLTQEHGAFLAQVPDHAIPGLLTTAVGDKRELHSHPDHGLRILHDWVKEGRPGTGDGVARRRALIEQALRWASYDQSRSEVAQHALMLALDPEFADSSVDPVSENTVTLRWSILGKDELVELLVSWARVLTFLGSQRIIRWTRLLDHLERWIYLGDPHGVPDDVIETVHPHVQRMIDDVVSLAQKHPGVLTQLHRHAILRDYRAPEPEDRVFRTLFPVLDEPLMPDSQQELAGRALNLAAVWAKGLPRTALAEIDRCGHEAEIAGISWPDLTINVVREIAEKVSDPLAWLDAAVSVGLTPGKEQAFLREVVRRRPEGWRERLDALLADADRGVPAGAVAICFGDLPDQVCDRALTLLADHDQLVQTMWLRGEIPLVNQRRILASSHRQLAAAAAVAEWWCDRGKPLAYLADVWSQAVLHVPPQEYHLREILPAHPELASPWLETQAREHDGYVPHAARTALLDALRMIEVSRWPDLLEALAKRAATRPLIRELVAGDPKRYAALLGEPRLGAYHLAPLAARPSEGWIELVHLALRSGYAAGEIVNAAVHGGLNSHWGPESAYWADFLEALPKGEARPPDVLSVIKLCRELVEEEHRRAVDRERHDAVHGEES